jgi:hypothetical protein
MAPRGPSAKAANRFEGCDLLVNDLAGATSFSATRYKINPGLSIMKGLSAIAARYDRYRFHKLNLVYCPKQAVATTKGMIHLAYDPNPNHGPPTALADLSAYAHHDLVQVYGDLNLILNFSKLPSLSRDRFVRCGPVSGDLGLYDAVGVIVAVDAMADTSAVGDIYLDYEVEFYDLQIDRSNPVPRGYAVYQLSADQTFTSNVPATILWDLVVVDQLDGSMSAGLYTPGCGAYEVIANVTARDNSNEVFTVNMLIRVNEANTSPAQGTIDSVTSTTGQGYSCSTCIGYVSLDSDDTVSILLTLTGATGTLTAEDIRSRLIIRALN